VNATAILGAALAAGIAALVYAAWRTSWVRKQDAGTDRMKELANDIQEGAMAFLRAEYKILAIFVAVVSALLGGIYFWQNGDISAQTGGTVEPYMMAMVAVAFILGALCSGAAGWAGMIVATDANVRTTNGAREGLSKALAVSFSGGAVMGMAVVGLALTGFVATLFIMNTAFFKVDFMLTGAEATKSLVTVAPLLAVATGFSLGASSIALFARVGGGIYTKAADVGADLVGKVEAGIPEDDPRNPATIADNVGDNVGDVAGMGADLFESYIGSIIGAMVLGVAWTGAIATSDSSAFAYGPVLLPIAIAAAGIFISIGCTFLVSVSEDGDPSHALHRGTNAAAFLTTLAIGGLTYLLIPQAGVKLAGSDVTYAWWGPLAAVVGGLVCGVLIGKVTEYYTSDHYKPVQEVAEESKMGSAPNIIAGLGLGMWSTGIPVILITVSIAIAYFTSGLYGIALAALGMLATTGIQLAVDAFGPIADNAGGIAEMAELPSEVRDRTDKLDAVGNTTAAIGKGFAIGSAALTSLALFTAFTQQANLTEGINLLNPVVMIGVFLGAIMPFVFSAMAMKAVGRSAGAMIEEVRRQFREIPGLLEGTAKAEHAKCVEISTQAALREMIAPGALALTVATVAGFVSPLLLGGLLAGVTTSGVAMAIFMSNAGGAWDNAKKYVEQGNFGGKGSDAHKAAVAGDTVGDPFKDTAGPALNILLKLMSVVALVLAPIIAVDSADKVATAQIDRPAIVAEVASDAPAAKVEADAKAEEK
jgi:K(+)-stimulated pyrophosphate-energized sodium pump